MDSPYRGLFMSVDAPSNMIARQSHLQASAAASTSCLWSPYSLLPQSQWSRTAGNINEACSDVDQWILKQARISWIVSVKCPEHRSDRALCFARSASNRTGGWKGATKGGGFSCCMNKEHVVWRRSSGSMLQWCVSVGNCHRGNIITFTNWKIFSSGMLTIIYLRVVNAAIYMAIDHFLLLPDCALSQYELSSTCNIE